MRIFRSETDEELVERLTRETQKTLNKLFDKMEGLNTFPGESNLLVYSNIYAENYEKINGDTGRININLSKLPMEIIVSIENIFKLGLGALVAAKDILVKKAIDYGQVFLLVHLMDKLKIDSVLNKELPQYAPLVKAMVIGKIVTSGSKLGT